MRTTATFQAFESPTKTAALASPSSISSGRGTKNVARASCAAAIPAQIQKCKCRHVPTEEIPDSYGNRLLNKTEVELLNAGNASKPN